MSFENNDVKRKMTSIQLLDTRKFMVLSNNAKMPPSISDFQLKIDRSVNDKTHQIHVPQVGLAKIPEPASK